MNKYERIYNEAQNRNCLHWRDSAVAALATDIEKATGKTVKVSGPFGLRSELTAPTPYGVGFLRDISPRRLFPVCAILKSQGCHMAA